MTNPKDTPELIIGYDLGKKDGDESVIALHLNGEIHIIPEPFASRIAPILQSDTRPAPDTAKLDVHIALDALFAAAKGEGLDPDTCKLIERIAKDWNHNDVTKEDIQALYDCGPAQPANSEALEAVLDAIDEMQIASATGCLNIFNEKFAALQKLKPQIRAALLASAPITPEEAYTIKPLSWKLIDGCYVAAYAGIISFDDYPDHPDKPWIFHHPEDSCQHGFSSLDEAKAFAFRLYREKLLDQMEPVTRALEHFIGRGSNGLL